MLVICESSNLHGILRDGLRAGANIPIESPVGVVQITKVENHPIYGKRYFVPGLHKNPDWCWCEASAFKKIWE